MLIPVSEISRRLADQCDAVCQKLLPGGKPIKGEWVCGDVSGGPGDSLKVHLVGSHAGQWRDWAAQERRGDLIDLWRETQGLTQSESIAAAKEWLGIVDAVKQHATRSYVFPSTNGVHALNKDGAAHRYLIGTRKIKVETLTAFKVEGKPDSKAIVFPCYNPAGKLINRSYRTLPSATEAKKVWQDKGCAPCLFGWHALPDSAYQSRTVLLCEGQIDCMTWHQWEIPALSIPNGSGQTWIEYEWDNLAAFDKIYISCDMDGAGAEMGAKMIERLGRHRCLIVSLPAKDANDCLLAGKRRPDAEEWLDAAKPPTVENLILAKDMAKRMVSEFQPKQEAFTLPFFRGNWPHTGFYFRRGEVTIWTGQSHAGKSTFLNFLALFAINSKLKVFIASMEIRAETTLRKLMVPLIGETPSAREIENFTKTLGEQIILADVVGYIGQVQLLEMLMFAFQRHGISHAVIDSLMRIQGLEEDWVAQGEFLNKLQHFAKTTGVHVHLVAHQRKTAPDAKVGKNDIKGSSLLTNNADNIAMILRNGAKEKLRISGKLSATQEAEMHDAEVVVEKQRETGWLWSYFLKFSPRHYAFSILKRPETKPNPPKINKPYHDDD